MRSSAIGAAILSCVPELKRKSSFDLTSALESSGWPPGSRLSLELEEQVLSPLVSQGILAKSGNLLCLGASAEEQYSRSHQEYVHTRSRFLKGLELRVRRCYSVFSLKECQALATDIESSLVGFFKEAGLSLATSFLASAKGYRKSPIPN